MSPSVVMVEVSAYKPPRLPMTLLLRSSRTLSSTVRGAAIFPGGPVSAGDSVTTWGERAQDVRARPSKVTVRTVRSEWYTGRLPRQKRDMS